MPTTWWVKRDEYTRLHTHTVHAKVSKTHTNTHTDRTLGESKEKQSNRPHLNKGARMRCVCVCLYVRAVGKGRRWVEGGGLGGADRVRAQGIVMKNASSSGGDLVKHSWAMSFCEVARAERELTAREANIRQPRCVVSVWWFFYFFIFQRKCL